MLTRSDFESAVKDALRHYTQADLLAENALLRTRLLTRSEPGAATPQMLQAFVAETAKTLFAGERDQRLYRVLDLTYLNPAPKQEAAAGRLGLSFSTYRRHLTSGVDRLTEWLWQQEQDALRAETVAEQMIESATAGEASSVPSQRPRLSIAVLPFLNLSQDPSEDYLVDGIVDSLITDLSRALPGSFVISRSTAFTYKGRPVSVREVGQELGVRYVLEGSVLAGPHRVRVNAQLIDAVTDEHLWSERFDKERKDIMEVQDEIVGRLSRSVGIEMVRSEAARGDASSSGGDVVDLVMRARALAYDIKRRENAATAVELFRNALDLDPDNIDALVGVSSMCSYQVLNLYRRDGRDALLEEAEDLLSRAAALAPEHTGVLKARALLLRARGRFADAVTVIATVIARNPGEPTVYKEMGLNKLYLGATEEAVEWFRRADAIAPGDPDRWTWLQGLGRALMQLGHDAEAVDALSQAGENNPSHLRGKAWLAAAEALAGDLTRAKLHLTEYVAGEPEMTVGRFAEERSSVPLDEVSPVYRRESERILEGLRRAGMPDGIDGRPLLESSAIRPEVRGGATGFPQLVTELIGRETELSEVADLVRIHRLVTLIGEGGIGKTRLGFEVARHLLPEFGDGARVAELAPLSDPALVATAVASALGLDLTAGVISAERIANALGDRELLLVLDNCEHVIDAAAVIVETLLRNNPAIRVLATSREPLRTEGEYLYRVPPLAVPAEDVDDLDELLRHGAVRLFLARGQAGDAHFLPDRRTGIVAGAICRRLDGIPLAIELAAARGAALGIEELASRLHDRFLVLVGGRRTALPRHQTLRATLDWSYQLLSEADRIILGRLAIFAGGFTLAAATAVLPSTEITASDVVAGVGDLVAKSLVVADFGVAPAQYRLLETTRAYALEKLTEAGELQPMAQRHAEYYRDLLKLAAENKQPEGAGRIEDGAGTDNIRAALSWAFGPTGETSIAVALAAASVPMWLEKSLLGECSVWTEKAVADLDAAERGTRDEMVLQAALGTALMYVKGMTSEAGEALTRAAELAEGLNDRDYQMRALFGLYAFRTRVGNFRSGLRLARQYGAVADRVSETAAKRRADWILGVSLFFLGKLASAQTSLQKGFDGHPSSSARADIAQFGIHMRVYALGFLAITRWLRGSPDQAIQTYRSSIEEAQTVQHPVSLCFANWVGSAISLKTGNLASARRCTETLTKCARDHSLTTYRACGLGMEGALLAADNPDTAAQSLRDSLSIMRESQYYIFYTMFLCELGEVLRAAGRVEEGLAAVDEALERSMRNDELWFVPETLRVKGELNLLKGALNTSVAEAHFQQALDCARRQDALSWELRAATSLSRLWHRQGRTKEALELLAPIYDRFTEGFETVDLTAAKALIDGLHAQLAGLSVAPSDRALSGEVAAASACSPALPTSVSELIGREAELSEVADLIKTHRLVTLIGEGGVGKTRLGIEVARRLLPEFPDGAGIAELAPLSDPALVPVTVATALGLKFAAGAISAERVANALGTGQLLLVLDNCEHVIDAAAKIAEALLRARSTIRVLATSREPLRAEGERVYRVPPLAVPAEGVEDAEEMLQAGSVQLFVVRARAADPYFSSGGPNAAVATAICRRLDGIPLAIELAASRGAALGIEELASRLDDRFNLLTGGHRTALPRHQTLRATLDWSYDLLAEPERQVLHCLTVFAGGFTLEAASAVAASLEIVSSDVVDCVANLIAKSLITADVGGVKARYRLLETTRSYVIERLAQGGVLKEAAQRHARYYRDLLATAAQDRAGVAGWATAYLPEIDNLRAALAWSFGPEGIASIGVTLTAASTPVWLEASLLGECQSWTEIALANIEPCSRGTRDEMVLQSALGFSLMFTKGMTSDAYAALTRAAELAGTLNDPDYHLRVLNSLCSFRLRLADFRGALALARQCEAVAKYAEDPVAGPTADWTLGVSLHFLGEYASARSHLERVLDRPVSATRRADMVRFGFDQRVNALGALAITRWLKGFPDDAIRISRISVDEAQTLEHPVSLCMALAWAGSIIALRTGDFASARRYAEILAERSEKHALTTYRACGLGIEGVLSAKGGDLNAGVKLLRASLDGMREGHYYIFYTMFLSDLAEALGAASRLDESFAAIDEALERAKRNEELWFLPEALRIKGELNLLKGTPKFVAVGEDHFGQALDRARRQSALSWELRAATSLSRLWHSRGRTKDAHELLAPIYDRFTEGFGTADLASAKTLLNALR